MKNPWGLPEGIQQSGLQDADLQMVVLHDFNTELAFLVKKHIKMAEKSGLSHGEAVTGILLPMCVGLGMMSAAGTDEPEKLVKYLSGIILENLLKTREIMENRCSGSKKSS